MFWFSIPIIWVLGFHWHNHFNKIFIIRNDFRVSHQLSINVKWCISWYVPFLSFKYSCPRVLLLYDVICHLLILKRVSVLCTKLAGNDHYDNIISRISFLSIILIFISDGIGVSISVTWAIYMIALGTLHGDQLMDFIWNFQQNYRYIYSIVHLLFGFLSSGN